jgi:hypothetical protein
MCRVQPVPAVRGASPGVSLQAKTGFHCAMRGHTPLQTLTRCDDVHNDDLRRPRPLQRMWGCARRKLLMCNWPCHLCVYNPPGGPRNAEVPRKPGTATTGARATPEPRTVDPRADLNTFGEVQPGLPHCCTSFKWGCASARGRFRSALSVSVHFELRVPSPPTDSGLLSSGQKTNLHFSRGDQAVLAPRGADIPRTWSPILSRTGGGAPRGTPV